MNRPVRILLPWFERREAIAALLGFRMPLNDDEAAGPAQEFEAARLGLQDRPNYRDVPLLVEPLPAEIAAAGDAFLEQMRAAVKNGPPPELRAAVVDLRQVIAFQKAVSLDGIEERVAAASADDWPSLAAVCLPAADATAEEELRGTFDKDGRGITITSLSPNLRAAQIRPMGRSSAGQVFAVEAVFGSPFINVVEYRGRLFLRDGYHRTYGLLARGIQRVPCIFERAASFGEVHGGGPSFVAQERLLGPQPPMLTDFHDPRYSRTVEQQAFRKVVRIRIEEFVVPI